MACAIAKYIPQYPVFEYPHMSGATNPDRAAQIIAKDIDDFEKGVMPKYPYIRA